MPASSRASSAAPVRVDAFTGCADAGVSPDMSKRARMSVGMASTCSRAPSLSGCSDTLSSTLPDEPYDCSQTLDASQVSCLPSEVCSPVGDSRPGACVLRDASTAGVDHGRQALPRPPALSTITSEDACVDHEHEHVIPILDRGVLDTPGIPTISADTLGRVLRHEYDDVVDNVIVIDCRYGYEFNGGHIQDAISACTAHDLQRALFTAPPAARAFPKVTLGSPVGFFQPSSSRGPMSSVTNFSNRSRMLAAPSSEEVADLAPTPSALMSRLALTSPLTAPPASHAPPASRLPGLVMMSSRLPLASVVPLSRVPHLSPMDATSDASTRVSLTGYRAPFITGGSEEPSSVPMGMSRIASLDTLSLSHTPAITSTHDTDSILSARGLSRDAQRSCDSAREILPRLGANNAREKRTIVVLHCEFSMERGPRMWTLARRWDRQRNHAAFPNLCYPDMYLLHRGYRTFYNNPQTQVLCTPMAYLSMHAPLFEDECKTAGEEVKESYDAVHASDLYTDFSKYQPHRARSRRATSANSPSCARVGGAMSDSDDETQVHGAEPPRLASGQGRRPQQGALPKPHVSRVLFTSGDAIADESSTASSRIMRAPMFTSSSRHHAAVTLPSTDENSASENDEGVHGSSSRRRSHHVRTMSGNTSGAWQHTSATVVRSPAVSSMMHTCTTASAMSAPSVCVPPTLLLLPMVDLRTPAPEELPGCVPSADASMDACL